MKSDLYTKSILTVIAICLTVIVLKDFDIMPKAYAGETSENSLNFLPNKNYGLIPVNADGSIDVNVKSSETLKVDVYSISTWDKMRVIIKENEDK